MKETRYIAFRCPDCGVAIIQEINLFTLSSGEILKRCSCGESILSVKYIKNRETVQLNVPCIACPKPHPYQVAAKTFFGDDMFVLQCTDSGLDIFFVGDKEEIVKAVEKNTAELQKLFELLEAGQLDTQPDGECHCHDEECHCHDEKEETVDISDNNLKNDEYEYYDAVVTSGMLYLLRELANGDKINCPCGKKELILDVGYDVIEISCDACQARVVLRAMTDEDIISLAEKETLELN
jgi:hypothetical protein